MKQVAAAFIFFTRLPLWRWVGVPKEAYKKVVVFWPLVGWITAGCSAGVLWATSFLLPFPVAVALALLTRLLLTGALHEDGLADFFDGFGGGGRDRERILAIMKDSHIGTYGVVALIVYFGFYYLLLSQLPLYLALPAILAADPFGKWTASQVVNILPYARTETQSKSGIVYDRMSFLQFITGMVFGVLPLLFFFPPVYWLAGLLPAGIFAALIRLMKKRIGGYTGDCCGALFLLCEMALLLGIQLIYHYYGTFLCPPYFG